MPIVKVQTVKYYICNVCGTKYTKEETACRCEKKKITDSSMIDLFGNHVIWKIGDYGIYKFHNSSKYDYNLCKIIKENINREHFRYPVIKDLETNSTVKISSYSISTGHTYVYLLSDKLLYRIIDHKDEIIKHLVAKNI